jgi:hypothetical protein
VLGLMRNVLESHIRFKFHRQTNHLQPQDRTFGRLITALDTANVAFRDNANRDQIYRKLNTINSLSCRPHHGEPMPNYAAVGINPDQITVTELGTYIRDTFDLIDNKL